MKIGIDIDGVLTDISRFYLDYGAKFAFENNISTPLKPDEYTLQEEIHKKFWEEYDEFYTKEKYTREFASEIIEKLKQKHEIHIITARNLVQEEWTRKWLEKNKIYYDNLAFTNKKLEYCKDNNIDLMIEDSTNHILSISQIIPVICFDTSYNKDCEGDNIIRCYSWYDIYKIIEK